MISTYKLEDFPRVLLRATNMEGLWCTMKNLEAGMWSVSVHCPLKPGNQAQRARVTAGGTLHAAQHGLIIQLDRETVTVLWSIRR